MKHTKILTAILVLPIVIAFFIVAFGFYVVTSTDWKDLWRSGKRKENE